jgi:hypothetical protein
MNELTVSNNFLFTKDGVESMTSLASKLAASDIIPQAFQKKPANVLIALDMANRLNASPMMVMQNMYVVYGNPGWSAKFLISTFNMCGKYSPIRYEFFGKPGTDEYGCRAYASELATGEKLTGPEVTIGMAKKEGWYGKNGSKWQTMPQLMLTYRAAAFFIRTCAPEISMGLPTSDELVDIAPVDVTNTGSVKDVVEKVEAETAAAMEQAEVLTPEPAEAPAKPERPF